MRTLSWAQLQIGFFSLLLMAAMLAWPGFARAADAILTVSGPSGSVDMDAAAIAALPSHETQTDTPWSEGTPRWTGPLLRDIYAKAGITADHKVKVTALNDYAVDMPASDAFTSGVILATARDGKRLSVRDKGPLFIIYPFAADSTLRSELIYGRSVWQVRRIEVIE